MAVDYRRSDFVLIQQIPHTMAYVLKFTGTIDQCGTYARDNGPKILLPSTLQPPKLYIGTLKADVPFTEGAIVDASKLSSDLTPLEVRVQKSEFERVMEEPILFGQGNRT